MADLAQIFRRLIQPLEARIRGVVGRGTISKVDDSKKAQELQVRLLAGEVRSIVERLGNYGFTSHPPLGSEVVVVFPGGSREHGIAVGVENRPERLKNLPEGASAMYVLGGVTFLLMDPADEKATLEGDELVLNGFTKITLGVGANSITIDGTSVTIKGPLNLNS